MVFAANFALILLAISFSQAEHNCQMMIREKYCCMKQEKVLRNCQITKLSSAGKFSCVGACFARQGCKSVNFNTKSKECHLNSRKALSSLELNTDPYYIFCDINESESGACAKHSYPHCDHVNDAHTNYNITGCLGSPAAENGYFVDIPPKSPIGATILLICDKGYMSRGEVVCQDNGTWSSPVCGSVSSCSIVKQYQPTSEDGEYWLRVTKFQYTARIYCHNMNTSSPEEFLTLPNINYGIYPPVMNSYCLKETKLRLSCEGKGGEIWFSKIKVNISTMTVEKRDKTFSNGSSGFHLRYGCAYDCYTKHYSFALARCRTKGRFTIDLRGTGWKVSENQTWEKNGFKAGIERIDRQENGTLVYLSCGGFPGGCIPYKNQGVHLSPCPLIGNRCK